MSSEENKPGPYDPSAIEQKWYTDWEENGYFRADPSSDKPPYSIVIPPPNVTGSLHMGHALNITLQDVLVRYKRMDGFETLWMPGTDHAGIATQNVVEKMLAAEGTNREEIGREKFIERVWKWKEESGGTIIHQLKRLGASCDWERERFTMDEGLTRAVREVFCRLYEEGLIYKDDYINNWCPRCHTAISDLEVEHEDVKGNLWHLRYPFADGSGDVVVATTRPETMLGDTAVAVNPDDERYAGLIGKKITLPVIGREIELIADTYCDPAFGTGAVKVTPAHDPNDFEMGNRHDLERVQVIGEDGTMTEAAGPYAGMDRYECRKKLVADLLDAGVLVKTDEHDHAVGHCYRCHTTIEPLISKQWFVRIKPMAERAIAAVRDGRTRIVPSHWEKTYFNWMENIRDWCISRQIWWGHRIPAFTCEACGEVTVARTDPDQCPKCGSTKLAQETDVLDTWFSSGLWPFSTMGWPDETPELEKFYPTSVLVTGFDILFFWVARMMMQGLWFHKEVPFNDVYIHALVLDEKGQKMSKSKGNVIDPLSIIDKFGADAFRFALVAFAAQGRNIKLSENRIEGYYRFSNKIWNAARFTMMNLEDFDPAAPQVPLAERSAADRWILTRFRDTAKTVRESLDGYFFNDAASNIYQFTWHELCDWYVEMAKRPLYASNDPKARLSAQQTLIEVFDGLFRLLHPFMPFISEELWTALPWPGYLGEKPVTLVTAAFPKADELAGDDEALYRVELVKEVVGAIRNVRGEMNVPPSRRIKAIIQGPEKECTVLKEEVDFVGALAGADEISFIGAEEAKPAKAAATVAAGVEIFLPLEGLIDLDEERKRLAKEIEKLELEGKKVQGKLSNPNFVEKAPEAVVAKDRARAAEIERDLAKLREGLVRIESN